MDDKERPEKRRKVESDKIDGVLPVSNRSPRVVLNKIKLKEDVLERLRKIKKIAQAKVKESPISTSNVSNKEVKEITEQYKSTDTENKANETWNDGKQKRKREYDDEDEDKEKKEAYVAKVARINSEPVAKETLSICESIGKKDPECIATEQHNVVKGSGESDDKKKDKSVSSAEEYIPNVSNSEEPSVSIATQSKGEEVIKAAQNYAKSGAQTEPRQDELLTDDKLVIVVTEVLEEGNSRSQGDAVSSEQESDVDNNNRVEQEETLSDEVREEDEDCMSNAIYQLIKDVVKNRTECFESALLRENERLEKRVSQLEKQNALLQRVGYRLDYALKEIIRNREEARQSCVSRGTQVNMNLNLSRTSISKSTAIEIDVTEKAEDKAPQPKSTSTTLEGKDSSRSITSTSKHSLIQPETISSKETKEKAAYTTSTSSTALKPEENRPANVGPCENKSSSGSERVLVSPSEEAQKKVSTTQPHKQFPPGMSHFRLGPSHQRTAHQQNTKKDAIETGHFRMTALGLMPQYKVASQRCGNSLGNEPSSTQITTKPSPASPRTQKMEDLIAQSSPNSSSMNVSSPTLTKSQPRSAPLSQAVTQEERSVPVQATSKSPKRASPDGSQTSSTVTLPTRSSPMSKAMPQEKRHLSTAPSAINANATRVDALARMSQTSSTPTTMTVSRASPLSSGPRTNSTGKIDNSQQRKNSANDDDPDIVIVSHTTISSLKEQTKKILRNETEVENSSKEKQVPVQEGPQPSNRQRTGLTRTSQQNINQTPQSVYRSHEASNASTALCVVPSSRSNEPQQNVRYVVREDRSRLQLVQEQPQQVDKGQHDPRHPPRHVVQGPRGQPQDPQQPRYIIQEGPPHQVQKPSSMAIVHNGSMQPRQPVPSQALPQAAMVTHQLHQGNTVSAIGPRPPPIGIQDVRTQPHQLHPTQQQQPQQHIIVKRTPGQNPQHPQQYTTYQYQQTQHRPTPPQQQNVPRTQAPVYYPPQTFQQAPRQTNNTPSGFQPRPTVVHQQYVTSSRIPPDRATQPRVPVGEPVRPRQQPPDVVYQPGVLEGSAVRPAATMQPHGYDRYQPRQVFVQQIRPPQISNQGIPRPTTEQPMLRPPNQGGARYVQTLDQQRIQERRAQGDNSQEKSQTSRAVGRRDSIPRQPSPPKPTASIAIVENGIVLSWNITSGESTDNIECYELFACQDDSNSTLPPILWKKIGVVKALPLPMACTLTQFSSGSRYQFAVRAVDASERAGPFSDPCVITLKR